jgi:hypothetical protein
MEKMKNISFKLILLILYICSFTTVDAIAYDSDITHMYINEMAAKSNPDINDYLSKSLGITDGIDTFFEGKRVWKWISEGGKNEDDPFTRCFKHFHDPLEQDWDDAGLIYLVSIRENKQLE